MSSPSYLDVFCIPLIADKIVASLDTQSLQALVRTLDPTLIIVAHATESLHLPADRCVSPYSSLQSSAFLASINTQRFPRLVRLELVFVTSPTTLVEFPAHELYSSVHTTVRFLSVHNHTSLPTSLVMFRAGYFYSDVFDSGLRELSLHGLVVSGITECDSTSSLEYLSAVDCEIVNDLGGLVILRLIGAHSVVLSCKNIQLLQFECPALSKLSVTGSDVITITCKACPLLKDLNISANLELTTAILPKCLEVLQASGCSKLSYLASCVLFPTIFLRVIDISGCVALMSLSLYNCPLDSLNIRGCREGLIVYLHICNCHTNKNDTGSFLHDGTDQFEVIYC